MSLAPRFSCAIILFLIANAAVSSVCENTCDSELLMSDCLRHGDGGQCSWCCEAPVGQQCMSRHTDMDGGVQSAYPCWEGAIVSDDSTNCTALCHEAGHTCANCAQRNWCYFCLTSKQCVGPQEHCPHAEVIQDCQRLHPPRTMDVSVFSVMVYVGCALVGVASLTVLVLLYIRIRNVWRARAETRLTEVQQPFLGDDAANQGSGEVEEQEGAGSAAGGAGLGNSRSGSFHGVRSPRQASGPHSSLPSARSGRSMEEDPQCFLCLEAAPSVVFLPCYHACCCEACSNRIRPTGDMELTCPFCRRKITSMVSLYAILFPDANDKKRK